MYLSLIKPLLASLMPNGIAVIDKRPEINRPELNGLAVSMPPSMEVRAQHAPTKEVRVHNMPAKNITTHALSLLLVFLKEAISFGQRITGRLPRAVFPTSLSDSLPNRMNNILTLPDLAPRPHAGLRAAGAYSPVSAFHRA